MQDKINARVVAQKAMKKELQEKEAAHLCCVMEPFRHGTKLIEAAGEDALRSMTKPVWHKLLRCIPPRPRC